MLYENNANINVLYYIFKSYVGTYKKKILCHKI